MSRSKRMHSVVNLAESKERDATRRLGESQVALQNHEARLAELRAFLDGYTGDLNGRETVFGAARLKDYRAFLDRLNAAIRHQEQLIEATQRECEVHRQHWLSTRRRAKALQEVAARYRNEERRQNERREQSELDASSSRRVQRKGLFDD